MNKFAQVIQWLEGGPSTPDEISEGTGISKSYAYNCLCRLKVLRVAYRAGFVETGAKPRTVWALGDKPDSEHVPMTQRERRQRHVEKRKRDLSFIGMLMQ